jgi:hypothetical protein
MSQDFYAYVVASAAFAMFIVCPRMAAMTNICHRHVVCNLVVLVILGTIVSIPLLIIMVLILKRWGFAAAIGFAIVTDLLSALLMGVFSRKATIEIVIISLFVISGSRLATWITARL